MISNERYDFYCLLCYDEYRQSRWPYNRRSFDNHLLRCNKIIMSDNYDQINDEFLSLPLPIVPWHQVTSLKIVQPFNSIHLHFLFSQTANLRILELHYRSEHATKINLILVHGHHL
jgi:hypothetical protein